MDQLTGCIRYFEAILKRDRAFLDPSVQVLIENTVRYLKELQEAKNGKNKDVAADVSSTPGPDGVGPLAAARRL